jgi:hypothetical protein
MLLLVLRIAACASWLLRSGDLMVVPLMIRPLEIGVEVIVVQFWSSGLVAELLKLLLWLVAAVAALSSL